MRGADALLEKTTLKPKQFDILVGRWIEDSNVNAPEVLAMARTQQCQMSAYYVCDAYLLQHRFG